MENSIERHTYKFYYAISGILEPDNKDNSLDEQKKQAKKEAEIDR